MSLLVAVAAASSMNTFDVPKLLGDRIDEARQRSGIAVLLPQTVKSEFKKLYPNTLPAAEGRYGFVLGASKRCNGASVCGVANFYAVKGDTPVGGRRVDLAKGRTGRYHRSRCGANCSFPRIEWRERKTLYTIEYKESSGRKNMKRLANSAIRNGAR
jgi:hypothetical protein